MLTRKEFIQMSLETNLFFSRIMKEHLFFIEVNLAGVNSSYIYEANILKKTFEELLSENIIFGNCAIRENVILSNELVTNYTLRAESITSELTGASINMELTEAEYDLRSDPNFNFTEWLEEKVQCINCRTLNVLEDVIEFKEKLSTLQLLCKNFMTMYPEMLIHLIEEAKLYYNILKYIKERKLPNKNIFDELKFWNHIMEEHGEFIRGLLDPTEKSLIQTTEEFVEAYEKLIEESINIHQKKLIEKSLKTTEEFRDFKKAATEGLLECKIRSIIPPLLGDHVLREANHYIRILKELKI